MSMTVFKQRLTRNFTTIPNEILCNPNMSWKAKSILCYLLSRPPEWIVHLSHLKTISTDGYDSTVSGINELLDNKYLWRRPRGGENPGGWEYLVFQEPQLQDPFRDGEIPTREIPESEKPAASKEGLEILKKDQPIKVEGDELAVNKAKVNRMFNRGDKTKWSDKELKALHNTLGTTEEEWVALLEYYKHRGESGYFCREHLITCLNNWAGEIDKAKRGKPKVYPKGNESSPSAPKHTPSGHKLSGREEEFWAWLKAWRPWEQRCDIRSVREDYVWDFLNGVVHEPEEPVTEIKLPRVEEDLF